VPLNQFDDDVCSIPDTAGEPEPEYYEFTEPRVIPLHDVC